MRVQDRGGGVSPVVLNLVAEYTLGWLLSSFSEYPQVPVGNELYSVETERRGATI